MALVTSVAFGTNIVTDPGFEDGGLGWTGSGWSVDTSAGGVLPHSGNLFAATGCSGPDCIGTPIAYFFQDLTTVSGQFYAISFWYDMGNTTCPGCTGGPSDDPGETLGQLEALWGGQVILNVTANNQADPGYVEFTGIVQATSDSTELEFLGRQDPNSLGVDDVCVDLVSNYTCATAAQVPEPSSLLLSLCGAGIGGFGFLLSRFRRRPAA